MIGNANSFTLGGYDNLDIKKICENTVINQELADIKFWFMYLHLATLDDDSHASISWPFSFIVLFYFLITAERHYSISFRCTV